MAQGLAGFIAYGAGMGTVVLAVALSVALARGGLVRLLRRQGRHLPRVAGGMLALAGLYITVYWAYALGPGRRPTAGGQAPAPITIVTGVAEAAARFLESPAGRLLVGLLVVGVVVAVAVAVRVRRQAGPPASPPPGRAGAAEAPASTNKEDCRWAADDEPADVPLGGGGSAGGPVGG